MEFLLAVLTAAFRSATPLIFGTVGELYGERAGILNLGIEGTMYAGAFFSFAASFAAGGSLGVGMVAAVVTGALAGLLMAFLTVTLGANQHVSGIGTTLLMIGLAEFSNRVFFGHRDVLAQIEPFPVLFREAGVFGQYLLTYIAFLVVVPLGWWVLARTQTGLAIRAVGDNPEAADAAGINVARTRYLVLMAGGALMGIGGSFFTLAALGSFTLDIIAGRGWVCIALVIFGRWRIGRATLGALLFAGVFVLQFRLRLLPGWSDVPFELLLALPYLVTIAALAFQVGISGRSVPYPGAYLRPYRRS